MNKNFFSTKIKTLLVIAPEKSLLRKIDDALCLVKKNDSQEYKNLFSRLNVIFITNKSGHTNEFFMPEKIWFSNKSVVVKNDLRWLASLIIHEAFHATQFKNGKYILPFGDKLEKPAIKVQEKFLKKLEGVLGKRDLEYSYKEKYWKKMEEDKISFVYFRNLLNSLNSNKLRIKHIKV